MESGPRAAIFPLHDLGHLAVESELGFQRGFFGLIADGWTIDETTGTTARGPVPPEAVDVECLVGHLDLERGGFAPWIADACNEHLAAFAARDGRVRAATHLRGRPVAGARPTPRFPRALVRPRAGRDARASLRTFSVERAAIIRIEIERAVAPPAVEAVRALLRELAHSARADEAFASCMTLQCIEAEIAGAGAYAPPPESLLLATLDGAAAGCIAARPIEPVNTCEMKRLYVRPAHRSSGLGRALLDRLLVEVSALGHTRLRLDILPSMRAARELYRARGARTLHRSLRFTNIAPYGDHPTPGAIFMERRLDG